MANLRSIIGEEAFSALPADVQTQYAETDLVNSASYVPKERFSHVTAEKNEYKAQLTSRDQQLAELQTKVKDNETLTTEIEALRQANTTTATEYEAKIKQVHFDLAIDGVLKESKARDPKLIKALLDNSKIALDGDKVTGLTEQIEAIKAERDYLFDKGIAGTGSFSTGGDKGKAGGSTLSLGERLAQEKTAQLKSSEAVDSFFK